MFNHTHRIRSVSLAALILAFAGAGLAACGGSSGSPTTTSANAAAAAGATGAPGHFGAGHFAALRECLQKNGVTLPARPAGGTGTTGAPPGGAGAGGFFGGSHRHFEPPSGVSRAQFEAAMKKCGGSDFANRGGHFRSAITSPTFRENLTKFAACMRGNGVSLPPPNTSGSGPIFDTKGLDTKSTAFEAALAKCRAYLRPAAAQVPSQGPTGAG